jgi:Rrf2 family iron-sulfur cluster assembly transcriptional regulator
MLSQTVGYAITALGHLAVAETGPILVRDIAAATDIPGAYLSKIINTLAKKGFVVTQRGIKGGVTLAQPPGDVTLYDLCLALDDPLIQNRCMLGTSVCSDERACPAHRFWVSHRMRQVEFLKQTSLQDVADFERRSGTRVARNGKG